MPKRVGLSHRRVIWGFILFALAFPMVASAEQVLLGLDLREQSGILADVGGRVLRSFDKFHVVLADVPSDKVAQLHGKHGVRFAEKDEVTRKLGDVQEIPWGVERVGAPAVWKKSNGRGVRVAVLDTGVDIHSDLRVAGGYTAAGIAGNYHTDADGHGTHIAGTIAALNNQYGVVGVAPEAELYAVKVLQDTGTGTVSTLIDGINWCMENRIQVANISLGTSTKSKALESAVQAAAEAGLLLVAAAGNGGKAGGGGNKIEYPAAYPEVLAVGAVDQTGIRAGFSATGPELDLVAPGVSIKSTFPGNRYASGSGTSMATPHVSGTAALVWGANPGWTNRDVSARLLSTAQRTGDGDIQWYGRGLVNAAAAVGIESRNQSQQGALSVSVNVPTVTVAANDTVTITVGVSDAGTNVAGAAVHLTVYTASGSSFTTSGYTDSKGTAVFRLRTHQNTDWGITD